MLLDNYVDCLLEGYELYNEESYAKKYAKIGAGLGAVDGAYNDVRGFTDKGTQANLRSTFKKPNKAKMAAGTAYGIGASLAARAGAGAAAGYAIGKGRDIYEKIKAKRAKKTKEVAVEEGVSLEEALVFVLECEQDLLNEGYDAIDIYFEDYEIYDEEADEKEKRKSALKKAGLAAGVGAAMGANQAIRDTGRHVESKILKKMQNRSIENSTIKQMKQNYQPGKINSLSGHMYRDPNSLNKKDLRKQAKAVAFADDNQYQSNALDLASKVKHDKESAKRLAKHVGKYAAAGAAVGAAAYGGKKLYDHIKAKRAEKAKKVAVEEGVSLEEAMDYVLECEQMYLNEGYCFEDIYE